jgi:prevent-host-death family protein
MPTKPSSLTMKSFAASEIKTRLGDMFMSAAREPVQITKRGKEAFVLMSEEQFRRFEAMEDALWAARAAEAMKSGFVGPDKAESLLQDLLAQKSA